MMFHQLEQSVPDYLIIDFYSDALKNVGYLDKEIAITISPIIEQSRIKDELTFTRILDHSDNEKYLSEWRKALQEFKKRIQPYFNNNQIIINFCELTTKYYDENKKSPILSKPRPNSCLQCVLEPAKRRVPKRISRCA
ncbi:hypothetical protein MFLO_09702 [Listeria floridensis FSL S10-1187]|uniref:Uncharacterized protein n=2 Tax=Listeria floridensis TaxID=1494962 RepID=A0ABN0REA0_9LIST|nr:DUF6270 domain-containing protein [Listeria floridensis]EUJ30960.1 hypothetical protein MFLO_09702 [Listeria floridensis FSL S10-1187]